MTRTQRFKMLRGKDKAFAEDIAQRTASVIHAQEQERAIRASKRRYERLMQQIAWDYEAQRAVDKLLLGDLRA